MWRLFHKAKTSNNILYIQKRYSSTSSSGGGAVKIVLGVVAAAASTAVGAIVYGKYDSKFKDALERNIPYIDTVYKLFPDNNHTKNPSLPSHISLKETPREAISTGLPGRNQEREKPAAKTTKDILPEMRESIISTTKSDPKLLVGIKKSEIEMREKKEVLENDDYKPQQQKHQIKEASIQNKVIDKKSSNSQMGVENEVHKVDFESAVSKHVAHLQEKYEMDLRRQLQRQAAAHFDHVQEVLKIQEKELERKFALELEEELLHHKGIFISGISGEMSRLKGISEHLKAKSSFEASSRKIQSLWLACQSLSDKVSSGSHFGLCPLESDISAIKNATDANNQFITSILAGIPSEAVGRGVYTNETLKQRFREVEKVCRKVALVDENNNSLYRYILSYIQSFLIIDVKPVSQAELEGKIAVDPTEWDTFEILARVSHCMKVNDLDQALRYANQLKGEPGAVAKDWMKEMRLLLEAQLAVKALMAHAVAVGVQAYH